MRIWKVVQVMFKCASPTKKLSKLTRKDTDEFSFFSGMEKEGPNASSLRDDATS